MTLTMQPELNRPGSVQGNLEKLRLGRMMHCRDSCISEIMVGVPQGSKTESSWKVPPLVEKARTLLDGGIWCLQLFG